VRQLHACLAVYLLAAASQRTLLTWRPHHARTDSGGGVEAVVEMDTEEVFAPLAGARATVAGGRRVFSQRSTCTRDAAELVAALARRVRLRVHTYKLLRVRGAAPRPELCAALAPHSLARLLPAVADAQAQTGSARGGRPAGAESPASASTLPPPPPPPPPLPRLLARRVDAGNPAAGAAPHDYGVFATAPVPPCELLAEYRCATHTHAHGRHVTRTHVCPTKAPAP
jgi:hypothetical protein